MDPGFTTSPDGFPKLEEGDSNGDKKASAARPLNRVPRACNACRKQKMRCEGADNPPCKRCRHAGLECLFEKPSREATLTGEAGLERIRSLEAHVAEIRTSQITMQHSQLAIQTALQEIAACMRAGGAVFKNSPGSYNSGDSPSQTPSTVGRQPTPTHANYMGGGFGAPPPMVIPDRQPRPSLQGSGSDSHMSPTFSPPGQPSPLDGGERRHTPTLPPFSAIVARQQRPMASLNRNFSDVQSQQNLYQPHHSSSPLRRPTSSHVTSGESTDVDDDGLPSDGLTAPLRVLGELADAAVDLDRATKGLDSAEATTRPRSISPDGTSRPQKRRRISRQRQPVIPHYEDVVSKGIIDENEARQLFQIFYAGCSTFLPVFEQKVDTYDSLHERSPFAVDCICMVAARVRDGARESSETYKKCLFQVQEISRASLFSPVTKAEAVQAMILVSGWSDNAWLSGGHAIRMAQELSMYKAWPKLLKRIQSGTAGTGPDDRALLTDTRTWFCLYLFEHQLSYGTGRPAVLRDDKSIRNYRELLNHPLRNGDDMRLVSTVELMVIRERVHNDLAPFEGPVDDNTFEIIHRANAEFSKWYEYWDHYFAAVFEDNTFYRQSLRMQHFHAELFHNASALRGINGPDDVQRMPPLQRSIALRSIDIARHTLNITVTSVAYREGMKYAVHYTHATATFAASLLLRLARLFPQECDLNDIRQSVERLTALMSGVSGKRYALTLQLMLKRFKRRQAGGASSRSPMSAQAYAPPVIASPGSSAGSSQNDARYPPNNQPPFTPNYDPTQFHSGMHMAPQQQMIAHMHPMADPADQIWRDFESTSTGQLPVWISDQSLGGQTFTQQGMNAFLVPTDYMAPTHQIW